MFYRRFLLWGGAATVLLIILLLTIITVWAEPGPIAMGAATLPTTIEGEVTWDEEGGPYIVSDKITVKEDAVLTIEPGVEVKFQGNGRMLVYGRLTARGTDEKNIGFVGDTGHRALYFAGVFEIGKIDAQYLSVENYTGMASTPAIWYDSASESSIRISRFADNTIALTVKKGCVTVKDSAFYDNGRVVGVEGGSLIFENNEVRFGAADEGLYIGAGEENESYEVQIIKNEINGGGSPSSRGIAIKQMDGDRVLIQGNSIANVGTGIVVDNSFPCSGILIGGEETGEGNSLFNIKKCGIDLKDIAGSQEARTRVINNEISTLPASKTAICLVRSDAVVFNNFFKPGSGAYAYKITDPANSQIVNNTIEGSGYHGAMIYGTILSDTCFTDDVLFYHVANGSLTITEGKTLTIEEGVVVKIGDSQPIIRGIDVKGRLEVLGSDENPVVFTSYRGEEDPLLDEGPPSSGDWRGIFVADSGIIDLEHVQVHYAGTGINFQGEEGRVFSCSLSHNNNAVNISGGLVLIGGCFFENNDEGVVVNGGAPIFQDNEFFVPEGRPGIVVNDFSGSLDWTGNTIVGHGRQGNTGLILNSGVSDERNSLRLKFNNFRDLYTGILVKSGEPVLRWNNFDGCMDYAVHVLAGVGTVDARYNWWGDPEGPYSPESDEGGGLPVQGDVGFAPWGRGTYFPDDEPPVVTIHVPGDGERLPPGIIDISASAQDNLWIERIAVFIDGEEVFSEDDVVDGQTYTYAWNTISAGVGEGVFGVSVKAWDALGNLGRTSINVSVCSSPPAGQPPQGEHGSLPGEDKILLSVQEMEGKVVAELSAEFFYQVYDEGQETVYIDIPFSLYPDKEWHLLITGEVLEIVDLKELHLYIDCQDIKFTIPPEFSGLDEKDYSADLLKVIKPMNREEIYQPAARAVMKNLQKNLQPVSGRAYHIEVFLVTPEKKSEICSFPRRIKIELPAEGEENVGVFRYDKMTDSWEYRAGHTDSESQLVGAYVEKPGIYTSMVYDKLLTRFSTNNQYAASVEASASGWENSEAVVLARGDTYIDALLGAPLAYQLEAPILLTHPHYIPEAIKEELRRLKASRAVIIGGKSAIAAEISAELRETSLEVTRVGGSDRFETAALIAEEIKGIEGIVVVNGYRFPDVLASAPYASIQKRPILLVQAEKIPSPTMEILKTLNVGKGILVGGTSSVSPGVEHDLQGEIASISRIGGKNRYMTALQLASAHNTGWNKLLIAPGQEFLPTLPAAAKISQEEGGLLLAGEGLLSEVRTYLVNISNDLQKVKCVGNVQVLPQTVEEELNNILFNNGYTEGGK